MKIKYLITRNTKFKERFDKSMDSDLVERFEELGINGEKPEFHAAIGSMNLNCVEVIHQKRKLLI